MRLSTAALCCAVMAGSAALSGTAQAQYYGPPPGPALSNLLRGIPNVVGGFGNAYGYRGGYRRPPPGWCPPARASGPVRRVGVNPDYHGGGYRCWVRTGQPAPRGDGFCVR